MRFHVLSDVLIELPDVHRAGVYSYGRNYCCYRSTVSTNVLDGATLGADDRWVPTDETQLATQRADVLVTHEAPSCHPYGFAAIDDLARALGAQASFHGHHHDSLKYRDRWEALGFRAYGVGFCGITDLDGGIVKPGSCDESGGGV